jgi:hypothetical protein
MKQRLWERINLPWMNYAYRKASERGLDSLAAFIHYRKCRMLKISFVERAYLGDLENVEMPDFE